MPSQTSISVNIKRYLVFFILVFSFASYLTPVFAVDAGLGQTMGQISNENKEALGFGTDKPSVEERVGTLVGTILSYVGVIFFILIVYGGLMWMTAQGNDQKVAKAKELIINATIGLIIVLSAYAITSFIGGSLTATT